MHLRNGKSSSERPPSPVWGDGPSEAPPTADPEPSGNWDTGDAGSPESILDPPNPNFYPESEIIGSYEVATNTEIYRISTIPDDFIGNSNEVDWPRALKAGHTDYKLVQKVLEAAEVNLRSAAIDGPADPLTMVDRCEAVYYAAYNAAKAREDFLKCWPSAFGYAESLAGHVRWNRKLENDARFAQREGLRLYRE